MQIYANLVNWENMLQKLTFLNPHDSLNIRTF